MEMRLIERTDGITHLALTGDWNIAAANQFDQKLHLQIAARQQSTILDLSGVTLITSLGMGSMVAIATSLRRRNKKMIVLNPQPKVADAMRMALMQSIIPIASSEEEALAMLK